MAVVLFIVIVGIFYAFLTSDNPGDDVTLLRGDAKTVAHKINCDVENSDVCVVENGRVDSVRLETLYGADYDTLRNELGVDGDFCIYLRDARGRLVPVGGKSGVGNNKFGIGTDDVGDTIFCE